MPPESWGSCIWKWSRKAEVNRSSPLCRLKFEEQEGWTALWFSERYFESQLYSDRFLILGRPS